MATPIPSKIPKKQKPDILGSSSETATKRIINLIGMEFVLIPKGTFLMGTPENETEREDDETLHQVTISRLFYLQATPVTQKQWEEVMGVNPSVFRGDANLPVDSVSWSDVQKFIRKLNKLEGLDKYLLPTEAQWEYACRAGSTALYCFGDDPGGLAEYAWYDDEFKKTHPVEQKKPNAWGLYDMHGNVWEWCKDGYGDYPSGSVTDPVGRSRGWGHVFRGGSCYVPAEFCRSALRGHNDPGSSSNPMGFRLVRTL